MAAEIAFLLRAGLVLVMAVAFWAWVRNLYAARLSDDTADDDLHGFRTIQSRPPRQDD